MVSKLRRWVTEKIKATPLSDFPVETKYQENLEDPIYTVIIKVDEADEFVDKHGSVWVRKK